jgi:hypothetical protein
MYCREHSVLAGALTSFHFNKKILENKDVRRTKLYGVYDMITYIFHDKMIHVVSLVR